MIHDAIATPTQVEAGKHTARLHTRCPLLLFGGRTGFVVSVANRYTNVISGQAGCSHAVVIGHPICRMLQTMRQAEPDQYAKPVSIMHCSPTKLSMANQVGRLA